MNKINLKDIVNKIKTNWGNRHKRGLKDISEEKGWIEVEFVIYFPKENPKELVEDMVKDITVLINGTTSVFNNGSFWGVINSCLKIGTMPEDYPYDNIPIVPLRKSFEGKIEDSGEDWKVTFNPRTEDGELDLYSRYELYYDSHILWAVNKWIRGKYIEESQDARKNKPSFNPSMKEGRPFSHFMGPVIGFKCYVEDRLKDIHKKETPDKYVFGESFEDTFKRVKETKVDATKEKLEEIKEWIKAVERLMESKDE